MDTWKERVFPSASSSRSSSLERTSKQKTNLCNRCQAVVYLTEQIRLSPHLIYHPRCFRCFKCDNRLKIQTFHKFTDEGVTEVYCEHHVPRYPGDNAGTDHWGELGIRQALAMQHENPLFYSAFNVGEQPALSRSQRRALEKRLQYSRRVCGSLSRLNRSLEDFRGSSISNSCETLSAFSCDDACSDIFYLPCSEFYAPQRIPSPNIHTLGYEDNLTVFPPSRERTPSPSPQSQKVSVLKHTTFSDQVEVIHIKGSSSSEEEEHKVEVNSDHSDSSVENPFLHLDTETTNKELSEYFATHCSDSADPNMSSISDIPVSEIKFADDSSEDDQEISASISVSSDPKPDIASVVSSKQMDRNEMRLRFLRGEALPSRHPPPPPVINVTPATPDFSNPQMDPFVVVPASSNQNSANNAASNHSDSSGLSTNSEASSDTSSSSSYTSSSDTDSDSDEEIDGNKDVNVVVPENVSKKPSQPTPPPSLPMKANPPGFVTGVLPKPISQQIPRPNRPPPPPPTNIAPFKPRLSDKSEESPTQLPQRASISKSQKSETKKPMYLETDLDTFIDPAVDEILNDPLKAPVGRVDVYKHSFMVEHTKTQKIKDQSNPNKFINSTVTTKESHSITPVVKVNSKPTSRSQSLDLLASTSPKRHSPVPEDSHKKSGSVPHSQENVIPINQFSTMQPVGSIGNETFAKLTSKGATIKKPVETNESPILTAPTWERIRRESSESDSSDDSKSSSETEFPQIESLGKELDHLDQENFPLTTDFPSPEAKPTTIERNEVFIKDSDSDSSSSSSSSSDSDDDEENTYAPDFSYQETSSLPDILDDREGSDSDSKSQDKFRREIIHISSIGDLVKFNAQHTQKQRIPRPMAPPPPRPQSHRVVMLKGPARQSKGNTSSLNLMTSSRSPRLRHKELTGSLPVIFERGESFGEADGRAKPKVLRKITVPSSSESSSSSDEDAPTNIAPPSADKDKAMKTAVDLAKSVPKPIQSAEISPPTSARSSNNVDVASPNTSSNFEGDDHMTTDLDDLSPLDIQREPKLTQPPQVLQETDLDEILTFNQGVLDRHEPPEEEDKASTASSSIAENHPDNVSTTSESYDDQLGDMEPLKMEKSTNLDTPDINTIEDVKKPIVEAQIFEKKLEETVITKVADDEADAAPLRRGIRSFIAELESKANPQPVEMPKPKPKVLPKPKPRRDSPSNRNSFGKEESKAPVASSSILTLKDKKHVSPSEKENTLRTERPNSTSSRPVLRDNYFTNPKPETPVVTPVVKKEESSLKAEGKPEYMNDYVPALMAHASVKIPPTVISAYPVYQKNPQQPNMADRGPPPPIMPKPTRKPPPPPIKPKPKLAPKPKLPREPIEEPSSSPPAPSPPIQFKSSKEKAESSIPLPVLDNEVKEMVEDVVRSRKPMMEDAERAEALRQQEMMRRREEERSREAAQEAMVAATKYQRSNEIAGNVTEMDRAIDEASSHISTIDNTLDRITGFNIHFMQTLESMPDNEISDVEVDTRSIQTGDGIIDDVHHHTTTSTSTTTKTTTRQFAQQGLSVSESVISASTAKSQHSQHAQHEARQEPPASAKSDASKGQRKAPADEKRGGQADSQKKKIWEEDSLSSDSSSSSYTSSYTSSSSSGSSSSGESSEEEEPKKPTTAPVKDAVSANQNVQPTHTSRFHGPPPPAPSKTDKPVASRLTREQLEDAFRTRHVETDTVSIASSTLSQPERLRMPDKVERFEKAIIKASGRRGPAPPLPPPRNPFVAEPPPQFTDEIPDYVNTAPEPPEKSRNPVPKPRGHGSSAESIESPVHERQKPIAPHRHDSEHRHSGHHHKKKKKRHSQREAEDELPKQELHYASSQLDINKKIEEQKTEKMLRDADRKAEAEIRRKTLSTDRRKPDPQERNDDDDTVFIDKSSSTLTRRRTPQHTSANHAGRSSVVYPESEEDEAPAADGRFGNRVTSLFKKKKPGEKDKRLPANQRSTIASRGSQGSQPELNPHRRSLSVDARTRKQRNRDEYVKSSECLLIDSEARQSRLRTSERRPHTQHEDTGEWLPTMDDEDDLESEYRRRSTGDGFYADHNRGSRDRSLRDARHKAQSEDHLGPGKSHRSRNQHRESAAYFDFDSDRSDENSDFDSPRLEGDDAYVNLPPRHGRSKSYDMLRDPKAPPRGYDDGLPGRLRGHPGKSGPGSIASSMMSVGDVRGKDLNELHRMVENYLERGRSEKLRTLLRALMIEDRGKMEHLVSGFNEDLQHLLQRWSKEMGDDRATTSRSDLLLSTLLLHGAGVGQEPGTYRRGSGPPLHGAPSVATILRTVYMKPGDQEEPPPGMRPPPRPVPPAMGKASLVSDELNRIDELAQEVANYDQTTFKELIDVLTHNCQTEVEKVRALFCWLTVKDLTRLDFDPYAPPESLLGMLRSVKFGEISYHDLFRRLCHYCGIQCEIIFGYSKGAGYRPGMNLKDTRMFENQWTAVYVANSWRFVNVAWGAPRDRPSDVVDNVGLRLGHRDDFYFLTDPEQHIFEHYPYQKRWQLMKRPISLEQFMNLPVLKSPFFNAGLTLKKRYNESLTTKDGRITVRLVMPRFVGITCSLENRADMTELKGLTLVRVMGEEVAILATPSQPGRYYLNIFVSSPDNWKDTTRTLAASFQIRCSEHNYDRLVVGRFPPVGFLGRTPASQKFGVSVVGNPDPLIVWNDKDIVRIPLAVAPGLKLMHRMKCFERHGKDSRDCQEYAFVQTRGKRTAYCVRCPANGYYYITLYAGLFDVKDGPDDLPAEGLECVHSFLIDCRRPMTGAPPFPIQTSRWNGCYLMEPTHRLLEVNRKYSFRLDAPHCSSVAVVVNGRNWLDLKRNKSGTWFGKIFTGEELGDLSVYGMFHSETGRRKRHDSHDDELDEAFESEENYDKLLDFEIVLKHSQR